MVSKKLIEKWEREAHEAEQLSKEPIKPKPWSAEGIRRWPYAVPSEDR